MKLSAKAQEIANDLLNAFETGQVPKALAQMFIHRSRDHECPALKWSWNNRFLVALEGHYDARGFRQWQKVGRRVRKGEKACYILAPMMVKVEEKTEGDEPDELISRLFGYRTIPVFGLDQTDGKPLPGMEEEAEFIDSLPLIEVAQSWGLEIGVLDGAGGEKIGFYRLDDCIGLGVKNLSTWAHELVHAADDRLGTLTRKGGQQLDNETVAEFGGAVLLECLGYETESDRGGALEYINRHAKEHKRSLISVCSELLDRTCACVEFILDTAEELSALQGVA